MKADPDRLRAQLEGYFEEENGPGSLGQKKSTKGLKGVVAPHIDFQRGGSCYAFAHREIWERNCFPLFHHLWNCPYRHEKSFLPYPERFCYTSWDFECGQELVDAIQSRCPDDLFQDEGVQRSEHSVEFQCLFLRYLYPEPNSLKIVPILSGSFHEAIDKGISPMELKPFRQFIDALKEAVSSLGREVCYIASADLAHMGLQFGDRDGVSEYSLRVIAKKTGRCWGMRRKWMGKGFSHRFREREIGGRSADCLPSIQCSRSSKPKKANFSNMARPLPRKPNLLSPSPVLPFTNQL